MRPSCYPDGVAIVPVLLPFRALAYSAQAGPLQDLIYIPGEEPMRPVQPEFLLHDAEPALYIYQQRFRFPGDTEDSVREGVTGLLDRAEAGPVYVHEGTLPDRLAACAEALRAEDPERPDPGSLWLWVHEESPHLAPILQTSATPTFHAADRFGCLHRMWRINEPIRIAKIQDALAGKELFLADGHHRYAAGWNLATIQIRTEALRTLPSHRLVIEDGLTLPATQPIPDIHTFWAETPPGRARFGVIWPSGELRGFEVPWEMRHRLLDGTLVKPVRTIERAVQAVGNGEARMALLVQALSVDEIEAEARSGIFLPPKSTDFYPKLAAGMVMYRHQNETVKPPVPHLPGVRYPSS
jgi:hypothetical protein